MPRKKQQEPTVHGVPDSLKHKPSRLLGDLDVTGDLIGANSVLAVSDKKHGAQPLIEADSGILEDRSDFDRELFLAVKAFPHQARAEK
jgi:hypothetical protein